MIKHHFFNQHLKLFHYRCSECSRDFSTKCAAQRHKEAAHEDNASIDVVYRSSALNSITDVSKVFMAFEEGSITMDMFRPEGGLDVEREDVVEAIAAAVRDITVRRNPRSLREFDKEKAANSSRMLGVKRMEMDAGSDKEHGNIFEDSIEDVVPPVDWTPSTNTALELSLHRRPPKRRKPEIN